jgi:hypothetical protein
LLLVSSFGSRPVKLLGVAQAGLDQLDVSLGCGDSLFRFLLKRMEHVNHVGKADGVDRPEGATIEIIDYLKDGTTAESFERFSRKRFATALNLMQRVPDISPHRRWESQEVFAAGAYKDTGLWRGQFDTHFQ